MAHDAEVVRQAVRMVHGEDGNCVVIPARLCSWLNRHVLAEWRNRHPGVVHAEIASMMLAVELAARTVRLDANVSTAPVQGWYTTTEAAALLRISDRAVRKAISEKRLAAELRGTRWVIAAGDLALYSRARGQG